MRVVPTALWGKQMIVADVEGNGQTPPEIIEIAVLPVGADTAETDMRTWLIRPEHPITPLVTRKVHGISNTDVADCPAWAELAADIKNALTGRVLVAHNASVEYQVLSAHLPGWTPPAVLDTLRLAKHVWPNLPGYGLDKLIAHARIDAAEVIGQRHHRAAYDTWCAWQLLCHLIDDARLDWDTLLAVAALPGSRPDQREAGLW